ncbi:MAG TPA: zinc-binding dehydrogenase, partial [Thermoanaerobaculia bacterium]|nr:zinc-binding dehydrogenase [Thermoanaerobaculia bacterium]
DVKCELCISHGADVAINYRRDDFASAAGAVDIVLDHIGARYLTSDLRTLTTGGRIVFIGSMGGMRMAELDVTALLAKRQQIIGSTLRSRPVEEKAKIVEGFLAQFGGDLRAGRIRPVIDRTFPLDRAADAHIAMAADHFGKIVLAPVSHQP